MKTYHGMNNNIHPWAGAAIHLSGPEFHSGTELPCCRYQARGSWRFLERKETAGKKLISECDSIVWIMKNLYICFFCLIVKKDATWCDNICLKCRWKYQKKTTFTCPITSQSGAYSAFVYLRNIFQRPCCLAFSLKLSKTGKDTALGCAKTCSAGKTWDEIKFCNFMTVSWWSGVI